VRLTEAEAIIALLVGILTALGVLATGLRWIYKQGVSSQKMVNALDANTKANKEVSEAFKAYTAKADGTLLDHEKRLTRAEAEIDEQRRRMEGRR
jgi:uncharacterized protein HemX